MKSVSIRDKVNLELVHTGNGPVIECKHKAVPEWDNNRYYLREGMIIRKKTRQGHLYGRITYDDVRKKPQYSASFSLEDLEHIAPNSCPDTAYNSAFNRIGTSSAPSVGYAFFCVAHPEFRRVYNEALREVCKAEETIVEGGMIRAAEHFMFL